MTDHEIKVVPVDGGWSVQCRLVGAPQMFLSGARAEETARRLAQTVARAGADARVVVHDRSHALVGTQRYFGAATAGEGAALPPTARVAAGGVGTLGCR
jgi:hypothetical protein